MSARWDSNVQSLNFLAAPRSAPTHPHLALIEMIETRY